MKKLSLSIVNDHRVEHEETLIDMMLTSFKTDPDFYNIDNIETKITKEYIIIDFDFDSKLDETEICYQVDHNTKLFDVLVYYSLD